MRKIYKLSLAWCIIMVLLFIDMLGVKSRWHSGGLQAAESAFSVFRDVMIEAMAVVDPKKIVMGSIECDSCAIVCENLGVALDISRRAFRSVFLVAPQPEATRIWLRGAIVKHSGNFLRRTKPLISQIDQISVHEYSRSLLQAIAVEKAGFKGMRIVVAGGAGLGEKTRRRLGSLYHREYNKHFAPFRRLSLPYPGRLKKGCSDYLWMASETEEEWDAIKTIMVRRLRWSASDPDEFAQAAATQVAFHACGALLTFVKDSPHIKGSDEEINTQS